jgi:hypothetical protein
MPEKKPLYIHKIVELDIDPKYYYDRWKSMDEDIVFGPVVFQANDLDWIDYKHYVFLYFIGMQLFVEGF